MSHSQLPNEQRDHLANVRTLLAWVRTAITLMVFGIVIDEFSAHVHRIGHHVSSILGSALILSGAAFILFATWEFMSVRRAIETQTVHFQPRLYLTLASVLVLIGVTLGIYLLVQG